MSYGIIQVPCGRLKICAENGCIISCRWTDEALRESEDPLIRETADQIRDYFLGILNSQYPAGRRGLISRKRYGHVLRKSPTAEWLRMEKSRKRQDTPERPVPQEGPAGAIPV